MVNLENGTPAIRTVAHQLWSYLPHTVENIGTLRVTARWMSFIRELCLLHCFAKQCRKSSWLFSTSTDDPMRTSTAYAVLIQPWHVLHRLHLLVITLQLWMYCGDFRMKNNETGRSNPQTTSNTSTLNIQVTHTGKCVFTDLHCVDANRINNSFWSLQADLLQAKNFCLEVIYWWVAKYRCVYAELQLAQPRRSGRRRDMPPPFGISIYINWRGLVCHSNYRSSSLLGSWNS